MPIRLHLVLRNRNEPSATSLPNGNRGLGLNARFEGYALMRSCVWALLK